MKSRNIFLAAVTLTSFVFAMEEELALPASARTPALVRRLRQAKPYEKSAILLELSNKAMEKLGGNIEFSDFSYNAKTETLELQGRMGRRAITVYFNPYNKAILDHEFSNQEQKFQPRTKFAPRELVPLPEEEGE